MNIHKANHFFQNRQLKEARAICEQLLHTNKQDFQARHLLGVIAYQQTDFATACLHLQRAHQSAPENLQILHALAASYHQDHQLVNAINCYHTLCQRSPTLQNYLEMSRVLVENNQLQEALTILEQLHQQAPNEIPIAEKLAEVQYGVECFKEARITLNELLILDKNNTVALNLLGLINASQGRNSDAEICFQNALDSNPEDINIVLNYAYFCQYEGQYDKAVSLYERFIHSSDAGNPNIAKACYNLSIIKLGFGQFSQAWKLLTHRPGNFQPIPTLKELKGKTILIKGEEGLGDELQFLRFLPLLKQYVDEIHYFCNPKLHTILSPLDFIDKLVTPSDDLSLYDISIAAMDLPFILKIHDIDRIKPVALYPGQQSSTFLPATSQPLLGITWRAGTNVNSKDEKFLIKAIPLEILVSAISHFKGTIVILQRNPEVEEIEYLRKNISQPIIDASAYNENLSDMQEVLWQLDEYIGVSNTNMHLYSSLGKIACVIIPYPGEWRWLFSGATSPWYPDFHLVRQQNPNQWDETIQEIKDFLTQYT